MAESAPLGACPGPLAYIDIDFGIPIALLAASIVGVVLVRVAAARGLNAAKVRTRQLIQRFDAAGGGMRDDDRASTE